MNKNMRKMFTEEQIGNIAKKVSSKIYIHMVDMDYGADEPTTVYVYSLSNKNFKTLGYLEKVLSVSGEFSNGDHSYYPCAFNDELGIYICVDDESNVVVITDNDYSMVSDTVIPL